MKRKKKISPSVERGPAGEAWLHYEGEATNCNGGLFLSRRDMSASELFR